MSEFDSSHDRISHVREVLLADLAKLKAAGNVKPALDKVIEIVEHLLHLHTDHTSVSTDAVTQDVVAKVESVVADVVDAGEGAVTTVAVEVSDDVASPVEGEETETTEQHHKKPGRKKQS